MAGLPKYYLVEASALPVVILKVAEALHYLETGKAPTIGDAVRLAGISRSAFYKYRDSIRPFFDSERTAMVTCHFILEDATGVLSGILSTFAAHSANILTINQSIPINGVASVTISAETDAMTLGLDDFMSAVRTLRGVAKAELIAR